MLFISLLNSRFFGLFFLRDEPRIYMYVKLIQSLLFLSKRENEKGSYGLKNSSPPFFFFLKNKKVMFFSYSPTLRPIFSTFAYELETATSPEGGPYLHASPRAMAHSDSYVLATWRPIRELKRHCKMPSLVATSVCLYYAGWMALLYAAAASV